MTSRFIKLYCSFDCNQMNSMTDNQLYIQIPGGVMHFLLTVGFYRFPCHMVYIYRSSLISRLRLVMTPFVYISR